MGQVSLLGLCLNFLYKTDVWAYALGLRAHIVFSTSESIKLFKKNLKNIKVIV